MIVTVVEIREDFDATPGREFCAFFLCRDGRVTASISYIRNPRSITIDSDPEVNRNAGIIIEHLHYNGVIGFDVRRSPDGTIAFIECNPRFWYRMDLASIAGLNVVEGGCVDEFQAVPPVPTRSGTTLQLPSGLLRTICVPWRLNRYDIAFIRYLARDPLFNTWAAARRVLGGNKDAGGQLIA